MHVYQAGHQVAARAIHDRFTAEPRFVARRQHRYDALSTDVDGVIGEDAARLRIDDSYILNRQVDLLKGWPGGLASGHRCRGDRQKKGGKASASLHRPECRRWSARPPESGCH